MDKQFIDELSSAGAASYRSLQELSEINSRAMRRLVEIQLTLATLGIGGTVEQAKLFTSSANYRDLLSAESELASQYGTRVTEIIRETADVLAESRGEFIAWVKKGFEASATQAQEQPQTRTKNPVKRGATRKAA